MPLHRFWTSYFADAGPPSLDEIRAALWHQQKDDADYPPALLDQYRIYVEMADRVSGRRALANTFFLSLNTAILAAIGAYWQASPPENRGLLVVPWLGLLVQCLAWFWLLRSYRQLNAAKYAVIGVMEERLPSSPHWAAEWAALGEGKDKSRYWPLSRVEQLVPAFFAGVYTVGLLTLFLSR